MHLLFMKILLTKYMGIYGIIKIIKIKIMLIVIKTILIAGLKIRTQIIGTLLIIKLKINNRSLGESGEYKINIILFLKTI